jgi:GLPGLI family protein
MYTMKRMMILTLTVLFTGILQGQSDLSSGMVVYEITRKLEIKLQGDAAQMEQMLPKEHKSEKILLFNQDASLYKNADSDQEDELVQESAGGATIMIKMSEPEETVFSDLRTKKNLEQREFMTRIFLIETDTDTARWKLTGNQKSLLGYSCMEAELTGSSKKTIAWFAPSIAVSTGPDGFTGLPGLILAMDIDAGKTFIEAKSIESTTVGADELRKPSDGKKVSREEFKKIQDEKMKEMNQNSRGGVFIIREER